MSRWMQMSAWCAVLCCVAAAVVAGSALEGYSHGLYPLGLLGADGVPGAMAFNVVGFAVPGLLAAVVAHGLYLRLPASAGWLARIGARMLLLSALAFAAQGLLPLDPQDLDAPASGLHASAWLVWWIAFAAGAPLLAVGMPSVRAITGAAVGTVLAMMFIPATVLEPPIAQRIALAAWLLWLALAPWLATRNRS
ncbi:DUF998 domain-containing protein [Luteimonas sp. A277]